MKGAPAIARKHRHEHCQSAQGLSLNDIGCFNIAKLPIHENKTGSAFPYSHSCTTALWKTYTGEQSINIPSHSGTQLGSPLLHAVLLLL